MLPYVWLTWRQIPSNLLVYLLAQVSRCFRREARSEMDPFHVCGSLRDGSLLCVWLTFLPTIASTPLAHLEVDASIQGGRQEVSFVKRQGHG